jgi:hypothetical protein
MLDDTSGRRVCTIAGGQLYFILGSEHLFLEDVPMLFSDRNLVRRPKFCERHTGHAQRAYVSKITPNDFILKISVA